MSNLLTISDTEVQEFYQHLTSLPSSGVQICSHIRPDGDSIGSQIALFRVLLSMGISAHLIIPPEIPDHLIDYLEGAAIQEPKTDEPLVLLDCSDTDRVFTFAPQLKNNPILLNIDHHGTNQKFAEANYVYPDACSTTHLLCELIRRLDLRMDSVTANALYLGIFTDSGQFKFTRTNAHVFDTCAWLCEQGAQVEKVASSIFNQNSLDHYRIQTGFVDSIEMKLDGQFAMGILSHESFSQSNTPPFPANRDCAELLRTLKGVTVSAYIESLPTGEYKCSLRSNDPSYPIDQISLLLGGGGHSQAAGATVAKPLNEIKEILTSEVAKLLQFNA